MNVWIYLVPSSITDLEAMEYNVRKSALISVQSNEKKYLVFIP